MRARIRKSGLIARRTVIARIGARFLELAAEISVVRGIHDGCVEQRFLAILEGE